MSRRSPVRPSYGDKGRGPSSSPTGVGQPASLWDWWHLGMAKGTESSGAHPATWLMTGAKLVGP